MRKKIIDKLPVSATFQLGFLLLLTFLLIPGSYPAVEASELPARLDFDVIQRIDFVRSDTEYLPLFPDREADRLKIERLVELYNQAAPILGEETYLFEALPGDLFYFINKIVFSLAGGDRLTMVPYQPVERAGAGVGFYTETPEKARWVTDPELSKELLEVALSYFQMAKGVEVSSRQIHLGEELTIRSDIARAEEVNILLMPSYSPMTIPSAPAPYPVPEAILIATMPAVGHDRFSYTFTLQEQMGQMLDGSPGKVGPGAWNLVVQSGGQTMLPFTILPAGQPEPWAVVYDRGRVLTWSEAQGVTAGILANPADQPLLVSAAGLGSPDTRVSLDFLRQWLDIPVTELAPGRYQLGGPELGLTVTAGENAARLNGTMISLMGALRQQDGAWQLRWPGVSNFLGYRTQWLGPETVAFLRNLAELPAELQNALKTAPVEQPTGRRVTITLNGKTLDLGGGQAYLDSTSGRVMAPLRATIEALGGKLTWFPLEPAVVQSAAGQNYGLPPTGAEVNAYADVELGDRKWRVYLTPAQRDGVVAPLRQLALALGYRLTWVSALGQADLSGEDFSAAQAKNIVAIEVNGQKLALDVAPIMEQNRVLVPLRAVATALEAGVQWDAASQTATITDASTEIKLTVGSQTVFRNGQEVPLYVPATQVQDRVMVPLRFVSEALGAQVTWQPASWLVFIQRAKDLQPYEEAYDNFTDLQRELLQHYREEIKQVGIDLEREKLMEVSSKQIDYDQSGKKTEVYFLAFALNELPLLYDPGYFVYQNNVTGKFAAVKIEGVRELSPANYTIRYEDISGDGIPEIFYEVIVKIGGSVNNANPHLLKYDAATGNFIDINLAEELNLFIDAWGFEDVKGNESKELWLDSKKDLVDEEPTRKFFALSADGALLFSH